MLDFNKELEKFEPMEEISVNDENLPEADNVENMADILRILADNKAYNSKADNKTDNKTRAKK
jgi:hypothetical protein